MSMFGENVIPEMILTSLMMGSKENNIIPLILKLALTNKRKQQKEKIESKTIKTNKRLVNMSESLIKLSNELEGNNKQQTI